jgi:CRP/FNR family transcriptional regulator, cyclic AMP receptor protein
LFTGSTELSALWRKPIRDLPHRPYDGPYFVNNLPGHGPELAALLQGSRLRKYATRDVIYLQGEEGTQFYYIQSGKVKISMTNREGYEKIVAICGRQTFIGEHVMRQQTYAATATALEESELYAVQKKRFESLALENPSVALMMLECVEKKLAVLFNQIADMRFLSAPAKVAHALLEVLNRPGQKTSDGATIPEKITHETLAHLTGLSRPTVTIILNDLEKMNIVRKRRGSLEIVARERLEHILDNDLL